MLKKSVSKRALVTKPVDRSGRAYVIAVIIGGLIGLFLSTALGSLGETLQLSLDRVYKFDLCLLASSEKYEHPELNRDSNAKPISPERCAQITKQAKELTARGISLSRAKAMLEHGVEGAFAGAGLGILILLTWKHFSDVLDRIDQSCFQIFQRCEALLLPKNKTK